MAYEVYIRLIFDEPCLGNERFDDPKPNEMLRNAEGNVIFQQAWWRSVLLKAADAYSKHQTLVKKVLWTPEVDGTVKMFERFYTAFIQGKQIKKSKEHEAFLRGDTIGVKALIPDGIPIKDFSEILSLVGSYYGISPFGWRKGYGKFRVIEVSRVYGITRSGGVNDSTANGDGDGEGKSVVDTTGRPSDQKDS